MACQCCAAARETKGAHRFFSPNCLWCGARLIKALGGLPIAVSECVARRRAVLADWMAYGHAEQELRALAKAPGIPLEPEAGPAVATESARPTKTKRR